MNNSNTNVFHIIKNKKDLNSLDKNIFTQFINEYIKCFSYSETVCNTLTTNECFNYIKKTIFSYLDKKNEDKFILFLVSSKDNKFITCCLLKNNKELKSLCVGTLYRKKGICGYLIKYIIDYMKKNNMNQELFIDCYKDNIAAIKCYKKYFSVYNEDNQKIYFKKN